MRLVGGPVRHDRLSPETGFHLRRSARIDRRACLPSQHYGHSTTDTVLPSQSAKVHLSDSYQVTGRLKLLDLMVGVIEGRPVDEAKYDRKSL